MPGRIQDALRWYATYTPDKVAIISSEGEQSYAQLWARVRRLANGLITIGVRPGDRVALLMQNSGRYLELLEAAAVLGIAIVPLNFRFVASEVAYIVNHAEARALVFDAALAPVVDSLRGELPSIGDRYIVADADGMPGAHGYEALVAAAGDAEPARPEDSNACYLHAYTSGTTGFPKGCIIPHGDFHACHQRVANLWSVTADDVELAVAPLFHVAPCGFALVQLLRGGTLVVTADPSPANVFALIARYKVSWAFMVPTMWASMVASADIATVDTQSLRLLVSGGAALPTATKEALLARLPHAGLHEFYGGSEVGLVTNLGPQDQRGKVRSVGKPVPDMYIELRGEDGERVADGEIGEIYVGGEILLREYFKDAEATARARSGDFLTLGDMGRFDGQGYLYIVDRKKDMIISGGENIYPNDIEDALNRHPAVAMAAVVGAPDPRWGEIVVAVVTLKPGQTGTEEEIIAHCKALLSPFKIPKKVDFVSAMPMSAFGKILRRDVRKAYWENRDILV